MTLAVQQPYFCPFPAFFYKVHLADIFVLLDCVQFPRGTTWVNRNRFKNKQGTLWLTVPVKKKGLGLQSIDQVRIYHERGWAGKHLESLRHAYGNAPYFVEHFRFLQETYARRPEKLVDLNIAIIKYLIQVLGLDTKVVRLSDLGVQGSANELLINICKVLGTSEFLFQRAAKKYLEIAMFETAAISLHPYNPPNPVYPQLWGDFIPNLSTFDLLFNCGPKARDILLSHPEKTNFLRDRNRETFR